MKVALNRLHGYADWSVPLFLAYSTINVFSCVTIPNEPWHEISNNVVSATSKASDQPAHTRSLIRAFASRLSIL